jgi:hypothetical protein
MHYENGRMCSQKELLALDAFIFMKASNCKPSFNVLQAESVLDFIDILIGVWQHAPSLSP